MPKRWITVAVAAASALSMATAASAHQVLQRGELTTRATPVAQLTQATLPPTVSNDVLPSPQIDGVGWVTRIVNGTVFVGGTFTSARPFRAPAGTDETRRWNLLAFDVNSGQLLPFAPEVNGEVRAMAVSEDGSRLYIGGSFTTVNGRPAERVAAFDVATMTLDETFRVSVDSKVNSLAVKGKTLYVGGIFSSAQGKPRQRLAAIDTTTSTLTPWDPQADRVVQGLTVSPDGSKVAVAGMFTSLGREANFGLGWVDSTTGAALPLPAAAYSKNSGQKAGYFDVTAGPDGLYASAWSYRGDSLEGVMSADWATGELRMFSTARGDTYGITVAHNVLYATSHLHKGQCIGAQPDNTKPLKWQRAHAYALGPSPRGRVTASCGWGGAGLPAPEMLHWHPEIDAGTATGMSQGSWGAHGNDDYLIVVGEFPRVNNIGQHGIVRFGRKGVAPMKEGPRPGQSFAPTFVNAGNGRINVSFNGMYDRDSSHVFYDLIRNNQVVNTVAVEGNTWWRRRGDTFVDFAPTGEHVYRIRVRDSDGNSFRSAPWTTTVTDAIHPTGFTAAAARDGAANLWRFDETLGSVSVADSVGNSPLELSPTAASGLAQSPPFAQDGGSSLKLTGEDAAIPAVASQTVDGPTTFALEMRFRTGSKTGGSLISFGGAEPTDRHDRMLLIDNSGRVHFAAVAGKLTRIASAKSYHDDRWHHVVANHSTSGMELWVDGELVAESVNYGTETTKGRWQVGGPIVGKVDVEMSSSRFAGQIDDVAVYSRPLPPHKVTEHYRYGVIPAALINQAPTARFSSQTDQLVVTLDGTASSDPDGHIATYQWDFGDGSTSTDSRPTKTYANAGTYNVTLTVADDRGARNTTRTSVTVAAPPAPQPDVPADPAKPDPAPVDPAKPDPAPADPVKPNVPAEPRTPGKAARLS